MTFTFALVQDQIYCQCLFSDEESRNKWIQSAELSCTQTCNVQAAYLMAITYRSIVADMEFNTGEDSKVNISELNILTSLN